MTHQSDEHPPSTAPAEAIASPSEPSVDPQGRDRRDKKAMIMEIVAGFIFLFVFIAFILIKTEDAAPVPVVLIYNADLVAEQSRPYLLAGYDGPAIIQQAFDAALARGHVIIKASEEIAAPQSALFRIQDFVASPSEVSP